LWDRSPHRLIAQALKVVEQVVQHPVALGPDGVPIAGIKALAQGDLPSSV
jgi:hypothetical protein